MKNSKFMKTIKKLLLTTIVTIATILITNAQNLDWAINIGGSGSDAAFSTTLDNAGNIIITGYFQNTIDFDPSSSTYNLTSNGGQDIFIAKYTNVGSFIWAKSLGSTSNDRGNTVVVDNAGNVHVAGYFEGNVDFDPGTGTQNLTSNGFLDIFILKLNASGNFVWAKNIGGTSYDQGIEIVLDASGNVHTTGFFRGTVDFDPGTGVQNLSVSGTANEIFVLKLNASGNYVWAKQLGGNNTDQGHSIAVDATGNIYTTGQFRSTADFDPGTGTQNLTSNGGSDVFISKLNASGNFVWAKSFGSSAYNESAQSLTLDAVGNVYTTGVFRGTVDFDPGAGTNNITSNGNYDAFVSKLDANGNFVWAKGFGAGSSEESQSIKLDALGNIYFTGGFEGVADFDPSLGVYNLTSNGSKDIFVSKLDASGNLVWANGIGGTSYDIGTSIELDTMGNIYAVGYFANTADFDSDTLSTQNLTSNGGSDMFIMKLNETPACTINIPDANFKAYLLGNSAINTNGNTEIECSEASAFNGQISCSNSSISDLTGIEAFINLTVLWCNDNSLSNLDVSSNLNLKSLYCNFNQISALNFSQNDSLKDLSCRSNNLTSLDFTQNLNFETLDCSQNNISNITFGQNSLLWFLSCYSNPISSLNLQNLSSLRNLKCHQTQLNNLDLSQNLGLIELQCNTCNLTSLDLISNVALQTLECSFNQITSLDLSNSADLIYINCPFNDLNTLNIRNGNNSNITLFQSRENPNLACIEVDDSIYSTSNWTVALSLIDTQHYFSENCGGISPVLVTSITVQGQGGISTITTNGSTLQMESTVLPMNADDMTYIWSVTNGTGSATIDANGLLTATSDGTVDVIATANDGSGITGTKTITISNQSVGIKDLSFENLKIYPNPSSGMIHIKTNETLTNIKLMDLTGKNIKIFSADDKTIDISEFDFGIYFLEIANEKHRSIIKIIKNN